MPATTTSADAYDAVYIIDDADYFPIDYYAAADDDAFIFATIFSFARYAASLMLCCLCLRALPHKSQR